MPSFRRCAISISTIPQKPIEPTEQELPDGQTDDDGKAKIRGSDSTVSPTPRTD